MGARPGLQGDPEVAATGSCGERHGGGSRFVFKLCLRSSSRAPVPLSCLFHFPLPETVAASARARAARRLMGKGLAGGRRRGPPPGRPRANRRRLVWPKPSLAFPRCRGSGAEAFTRLDTPLRVPSLSQVVVGLEVKTQNDSRSLVLRGGRGPTCSLESSFWFRLSHFLSLYFCSTTPLSFFFFKSSPSKVMDY